MEINDKEDIWQLGVTILFLKSGKHPFAVNTDAGDLAARLWPIAALADGDVQAAMLRAGVKPGSQLASFLSRCLAIEPAQRATAADLHASGWISGASATQFVRDGGAAMRDVSSTLTTIQSNIRDVHADVKDIKGQLTKVLSGIEAVQRTIVNLDSSRIPLIFCIEITPRDPSDARWESRLKAVFSAGSALAAVQAAVDDMDAGTFTLRLLCQYSWEPVGAGYRIQAPRDSVPKLLPLLSVGLKGMKAVRGIGNLGRMLGLSLPDLPESAVGAAEKLVDGLGSEFACVTAAAGAAAARGSARARTAVSKFQLAEFEAFLRQHDPKEAWKAQLARVALRSGQVFWVSEGSNAMLQAQGQLGAAPPVRPAPQNDML
jgi:hypothetical protein